MRKNNKESGQVIVIVTFGIIALFAMVGLAIDGGSLFSERRKVQNTVDNSALAAASAICSGVSSTEIRNTAISLSSRNGYTHDGIITNVAVSNPYNGDENSVEVIITRIVPSSFIQLVYPGDLVARARAVGNCAQDNDFLPIPFAAYGGDSECSEAAIVFSGNENFIDGPVHSNSNWKLSGTNNSFGDVSFAGSDEQTQMPNSFVSGPTDNNQVYDWPIAAFEFDDYAPGGIYSSDPNYHSSDKFDFSDSNISIPEGIYYATDEIILGGDNISGNVTLVVSGSDGKISFSGNNHNLSPYINDLLVFAKGKECTADAINFNGNDHIWEGIVYSPYGQIQMSGNENNTLDGCLWGAQVKFNGNELTIQNCDDYFHLSINLSE